MKDNLMTYHEKELRDALVVLVDEIRRIERIEGKPLSHVTETMVPRARALLLMDEDD